MKNKILLLIVIFSTIVSCETNSKAKQEFHIYLNENQCLYCYNNLISVNNLPKDVKLIFFTKKNSFDTWKELFKQLKITKKYELRVHKNTITNNYVEFYKNKTKVDSFPLERLPEIIHQLYAQNNNLSIQDSISLEGTTLSSRNIVQMQGIHLVLNDYLLNAAHIINLESKKIQKVEGKDFNPKDFLKLIDYNKEDYEKSLPEMKKQNLDKIKIASVYYKNDTLTIVSAVSIPEIQDDETAIKSYLIFGDYVNNEWINLYCPEQMLNYKENMYGIFDKVYRYENNFITNLITPTLHKHNALWAKFKENNNQLSVEVLDHTHPEIAIPKQLYPHSSMGVHDDWLFLNYFPLAFHPKTNKLLDYSNYLQDSLIEKPVNLSSSKLKIVDLIALNQNMSVIYKSNGEYYLVKFNSSTNETLYTKRINIPERIKSNTIRFVSEHEFCALAEDRKNIYLIN